MRIQDGSFVATITPADVPDAARNPHECARWLHTHAASRLTKAEKEFVSSLARCMRLSKRQLDWLESIADGIACELQCETAGMSVKRPRG